VGRHRRRLQQLPPPTRQGNNKQTARQSPSVRAR
jgi:hypothetical protein